jgi:hypothetical protein
MDYSIAYLAFQVNHVIVLKDLDGGTRKTSPQHKGSMVEFITDD